MTNEKDDESISPEQLRHLLETLPNVRRLIARKLGKAYHSAIEDVAQRVFLKLWRWKKSRLDRNQSGGKSQKYRSEGNAVYENNDNASHPDASEHNSNAEIILNADEWQRMANIIARNEIIDFFREKYTRCDVPFSQLDQETNERVFALKSDLPEQNPEGNSQAELCSQVRLIWKAAQALVSVRQKYAYFLSFPDFIIEFILCGCCSIEKLAEYFETDDKGLSQIIGSLPLTDEEIGHLLETNFGERLTPKQMWEARAKAKRKLARRLSEYISDERLFIKRGDRTLE